MQNNFLVLLPPILVLIIAFSTHRILLALATGIISASIIACDFSIYAAISKTIQTIWQTTELENLTSLKSFIQSSGLLLFCFLIVLGIIIIMMSYGGGATAYREFVEKKINTKKGVEKSSLILSIFFFLDDYFSTVTVGSVMNPLTDKFKIAKVKLAFLVNSIAAPLCIITPISSWSAAIVMNLSNAGVSDIAGKGTKIFIDPFYLYLGVIPFVLYPFVMILSTWFISTSGISFGLMKKHEEIAAKTGNLFGGKPPKPENIKSEKNNHKDIYNFILPLLTLIISILILFLYTGNYHLLGGDNTLLEAIKTSNANLSLFLGGVITLAFTTFLFLIKKVVKLKKIPHLFWEGVTLLGPSIFVLILAWSLTEILNSDLETGQYLAHMFVKFVNIRFLPIMFFIITGFTAGAIGSAWGSMAIMIPISIEMLVTLSGIPTPINPSYIPMLYPILGAILSGAVIGNHISPTSDTMVMSAKSSGAYHMDHVRTQHTYSIPALISSAFGFLLSGFLIQYSHELNVVISLSIAILLNFAYLIIRNNFQKT